MNKEMEPIKLVFTSYKESIKESGLKVSIERHTPRPCSYPTLSYLVIPTARNLTLPNMERLCHAILDNNWNLIRDFIDEIYGLGLRQIVFCCWCTKEQISKGKLCLAGIIGQYIQDKAHRDKEFEFPVEIEYQDGRIGLQ